MNWKYFTSVIVFVMTAVLIPEARAEKKKVWIFFKDKGPQALSKTALEYPSSLGISERAIKRRIRVMREESVIQETDLPVFSLYLQEINYDFLIFGL